MKPNDTRAALYRPHVDGKLPAVSFVTVGELLFGATKKQWSPKKIADLHSKLRSVVVVPYDLTLCERYAELKTKLRCVGRVVADNDLWIAATAIRHSIPLVSHNRSHFDGIPDLALISEAPAVKEIQTNLSEIPGFESEKKTEEAKPEKKS
jgi:tRNA(fMet)-specific endonuclease VapC